MIKLMNLQLSVFSVFTKHKIYFNFKTCTWSPKLYSTLMNLVYDIHMAKSFTVCFAAMIKCKSVYIM